MSIFAIWPLSLLIIANNLFSGFGISESIAGGFMFIIWSTITTFILALIIGTPIFLVFCSLGIEGYLLAALSIIASAVVGWWFSGLFGKDWQNIFILIGMYSGFAYWYGATKIKSKRSNKNLNI